MKKRWSKAVLILMTGLLVACQDPIFWLQQTEQKTESNNLNKKARIFDVDASDSAMFAIVGGRLYRRMLNSNRWDHFGLPQLAHSLDVDNNLITLTDGIFQYNFTTMSLGAVQNAAAHRAFIDKDAGKTVSYGRVSGVNQPMEYFEVDGQRFNGARYVGVLGSYIVATNGVFNADGSALSDRFVFRDPRATDGVWLAANDRVGPVAGTAFDGNAVNALATSVLSNTNAFNTVASDGSAPTVAIFGTSFSGYREVFVDGNGNYVARNPLTTVSDFNVYRASELSNAYVERFFFKNGILFALTTSHGLWTQSNGSGVWVWE